MKYWTRAALAAAALVSATPALADTCEQLTSSGLNHSALKATLFSVVGKPGGAPNGGLGFPMWLSLVDGSGRVCDVSNSLDGSAKNADATADIWLGSRVISAQKANTANAFSTGILALSTANLYAAVQPGGSLFGLQESNPVNTEIAYDGNIGEFGSHHDPLVGRRIGGVNVFGGGLALYKGGKKIGAIGVSATPPAPTTWSPGRFARSSSWMAFRLSAHSTRCFRTSTPTATAPADLVIRSAA